MRPSDFRLMLPIVWWKSVKLVRQTNGGIARERLILLMMPHKD